MVGAFLVITIILTIFAYKLFFVSEIPFIKIEKKTVGKIEQAKLLIKLFCVLSNIKLSDAELNTLAFYMVYGISSVTKDLILKSKVLANEDSLRNTLSKLRKVGLIKKVNREDKLNDSLGVKLEPVIGMLIKIDNK